MSAPTPTALRGPALTRPSPSPLPTPQVECKKAVPKEEQGSSSPPSSNEGSAVRTKKIFVGGLAPTVDDKLLREHFEQFGAVEDAVVMYDHDNKRPRGFGFVTFAAEESVDKVFGRGAMQTIQDKQIEIKPAVPRDQMQMQAAGQRLPFFEVPRGGFGFAGGRAGPGYGGNYGMPPYRGYGPRGAYNIGPGGAMGPPPPGLGGPSGRGGPRAPYPGPPFPAAAAAAAMGRGYGAPNFPSGKMAMAGNIESLYGAGLQNGAAAGMFAGATNAQALYNHLAQTMNGVQGPGNKLNFAANAANLKALNALALASGLGAFPTQAEGFGADDPSGYAAQDPTDYAEAAAAAVNLNASGLGVTAADFHHQYEGGMAGFGNPPGPGWSGPLAPTS